MHVINTPNYLKLSPILGLGTEGISNQPILLLCLLIVSPTINGHHMIVHHSSRMVHEHTILLIGHELMGVGHQATDRTTGIDLVHHG